MNALRAHLRRATSQRLRRLCAALAVVLATVAWMRVTYAQMQASEAQIKAAFIYNFALFTTWPTDAMLAGAPMVVCVTAEHPLQAALEKLTGKPVRGHRLEIRQINDGAIGGCHLLVLDAQSSRGVRLDPATPVLTVGDGHKGALTPMIALALQDNRVVFDIDAGAARQAGLQLSSQLLRLARSVQ
ncbi:YfiR family protein [Ralstonia sp. 24A2]|uniref:YfiR family protein n=1 Tax=Ralstonia sp. 24A2 TaxID=3447364 RepID=UPI003F6A24E9